MPGAGAWRRPALTSGRARLRRARSSSQVPWLARDSLPCAVRRAPGRGRNCVCGGDVRGVVPRPERSARAPGHETGEAWCRDRNAQLGRQSTRPARRGAATGTLSSGSRARGRRGVVPRPEPGSSPPLICLKEKCEAGPDACGVVSRPGRLPRSPRSVETVRTAQRFDRGTSPRTTLPLPPHPLNR